VKKKEGKTVPEGRMTQAETIDYKGFARKKVFKLFSKKLIKYANE